MTPWNQRTNQAYFQSGTHPGCNPRLGVPHPRAGGRPRIQSEAFSCVDVAAMDSEEIPYGPIRHRIRATTSMSTETEILKHVKKAVESLTDDFWFALADRSRTEMSNWIWREWWHMKYCLRTPNNDPTTPKTGLRGEIELPYERQLFYPATGRFALTGAPGAFEGSAVVGADLSEALLSRADLRDADLSLTNLRGAIFEHHTTRLDRTRLVGAFALNAEFKGASLLAADLRGADLRRTRFDDAKLDKARFLHSDLTQASFRGAVLKQADFRGAILAGVVMTGAGLQEAIFSTQNDGTRVLPNYQGELSVPVREWLTDVHDVVWD